MWLSILYLQEALYSLQTDAGLQQLLPRFSVAIVEGVSCLFVSSSCNLFSIFHHLDDLAAYIS